ncbi:MAG: hypothetical protein R8G66_24445 [Cytophagales bacterium]|nr:hypothetical protein [Cytophagales bacterium]
MKANILTIIVSMVLISNSWGQSVYRDGYIIDQQGDTTLLKIKDRFISKRDFVIVEEQGVQRKIPAEQLKYLQIFGDRLFKIDSSKFYQVHIHGPISLYQYNGFLWAEKDHQKTKLKTEIATKKIHGLTKEVFIPVWRNALARLTGSCISIEEYHELSVNDLIEILSAYYACSDEPHKIIKLAKTKHGLTFRFGANATQSIINVKKQEQLFEPSAIFRDLDGIPFTTPKKYYSTDQYYDVSLAINLDRRNEFFLQSGLIFGSSTYSGIQEFASDNKRFVSRLSYDAVSIPLKLALQFGSEKFKLNGGIGIFYSKFSNINTLLIEESTTDYGRVTRRLNDALKIHNSLLGYSAEIGGSYHFGSFQTGLLLRYSLQNGIAPKPALSATYIQQSAQLFFGYTLNSSKK